MGYHARRNRTKTAPSTNKKKREEESFAVAESRHFDSLAMSDCYQSDHECNNPLSIAKECLEARVAFRFSGLHTWNADVSAHHMANYGLICSSFSITPSIRRSRLYALSHLQRFSLAGSRFPVPGILHTRYNIKVPFEPASVRKFSLNRRVE